MGKYKIALSDRAKDHLSDWKRSGQLLSVRKIERIFQELSNTPFAGIGSPEPLKYKLTECWSRQIDKKNRIIYQVNIEIDTVFIISVKGHYSDK
ncbi:MAG: Txe/YoeB family addiction module toxin [Draconibacterium sp.]|nr:Txe/YoeB family addiction module toxin [Draconibacterium sp.]